MSFRSWWGPLYEAARSQTGCGLFACSPELNLQEESAMIVILKHNPNREQLDSRITWLQEKGVVIR